MKHTFWIILLIFALICGLWQMTLATGEGQEDNTGEVAESDLNREDNLNPWKTILDIEDPIGDDYGPGTYLYPTNSQFAPYEGIFDIQKFTIAKTDEQISFQITFGQITNPWNGPFGFSHQLIEIYIDHRPGGERYTLYPGARVVFSPRASWDTLIKVTGWGLYRFDCTDKPMPVPEPYLIGSVTVLEDQKTIQIMLPLTGWCNPEDLADSSYYLLVGGQDGFGPDNYRVVKKGVHEWYFGGGDDSGYAPNVIDIVVPPGRSQQEILGSYDPTNHVRAVVEPVSRPNPLRKGIIYLVSILICGLIWMGWRTRDIFTRSS